MSQETRDRIKWQKACARYFKTLDALQKTVFAGLMEQDPPENALRRIRLTLFDIMQKLRFFTHPNAREKIATFESLYEIIFSLNTLRPHLSDPAILEICKDEFKKIVAQLSNTLKQAATSSNHCVDRNETLNPLSNQIDTLDELYHTTLQVVSPEPIFFLFFMRNLMALRDTLALFFQERSHD